MDRERLMALPECMQPGWDPFRPGREMEMADLLAEAEAEEAEAAALAEQEDWENDPDYRALYGMD